MSEIYLCREIKLDNRKLEEVGRIKKIRDRRTRNDKSGCLSNKY